MIDANALRKGVIFELDGELYKVKVISRQIVNICIFSMFEKFLKEHQKWVMEMDG